MYTEAKSVGYTEHRLNNIIRGSRELSRNARAQCRRLDTSGEGVMLNTGDPRWSEFRRHGGQLTVQG